MKQNKFENYGYESPILRIENLETQGVILTPSPLQTETEGIQSMGAY